MWRTLQRTKNKMFDATVVKFLKAVVVKSLCEHGQFDFVTCEHKVYA